jgi:glycosyltransferase involved in cell wall biosynthesis
LVSVVIPAYNSHTFIARALDSALAQTYSNLEIILINDGSSDTELLEQKLAPYLSRIRYLTQENRGPSGARNLGIQSARGEYVAFLDSDDAWLPHHVATQVALLTKGEGVDLAYADFILMEGSKAVGHAFGTEPQSPPVTFEALLSESCTVGTSSTVASRQAMIDAGLFDERFRRCEDFDLWLRMRFRGSRMDFSQEPGVYHFLTEDSLAADTYQLKRSRIEVYEKTASTLPINSAQKSLIQHLITKTEANCQKDLLKGHLRAQDYEKALEAATTARKLSPGDWRLQAAVVGLQRMPGLFRQYHRIHERFLEIRARLRSSQKRNLKVSTSNLRG